MFGIVAAPLVTVLLAQSGWMLAQAKPREVGRTYWESTPETEIWLRLIPEHPEGKAPLVNLVFHAYFPGRAERDPYTGLPQWPKGAPARLTVSAEPLPYTLVRELALQLVIDGKTIDLTGPGGSHRNLPCAVASEECAPNGVEADLEPSLLRALAGARSVGGRALGFAFKLVPADQDSVRALGAKAGVG
jgi:hypothetical protein